MKKNFLFYLATALSIIINVVLFVIKWCVELPMSFVTDMISSIILAIHTYEKSTTMFKNNSDEGKPIFTGFDKNKLNDELSDKTATHVVESKFILFLYKSKFIFGLLIWSALDKFIFHVILK